MNIVNREALESLGQVLLGLFDVHSKERNQLEQQWLKNLRQYKAIYDPDVKIPDDKSKVYPKDTHTKIVGWVAKLMEMMFPAQEKNWELKPTPFPNIAKEDLDSIIATLEASAQQAAEQASQESGEMVSPQPVTSEAIEKAVKKFAEARALRMETECDDQLQDANTDFPELCKKTIRRGGIYGFGVVEGPQVRTVTEREWAIDPATGAYVAKSNKKRKPYYTNIKAWDVYPDLSAKTWDSQNGLFIRKVFNRTGLRELAKRDDFFGEIITEYLRDHDKGNYKAQSYETELNEIKKVSTSSPDMSRQFEVLRWYGFVQGRMLKDIGIEGVTDAMVSKEVLADVWLLDGVPIKADMAPFGENVADMFHVFIPEEDEDGPLTGTAKVEVLRDSQMKLCSIDRATMDNMAATAGAVTEVNIDLLAPGQEGKAITGGTTIYRRGEMQEAQYPAVRTYNIESHIGELLQLRESVLGVFDVESNLPSWRMGDTKPLGEAFRTSNNMSMMSGGADMVTKDDARAFDRFVKSLIGSLVRWNMEFNDKEDIKGDFNVQPKGAMSLVAKEVRGAALDQTMATLTPRERVMVDERGILIDRFRARDLPLDRIKDEKEAQAALEQFDQAQAKTAQVQMDVETAKAQSLQAKAVKDQAQADEIAKTVDTRIQETLSRIAANLANAKGKKDANALQQIKLLLDAVGTPGQAGGTGNEAKGSAATQ